MTYMQQLSEKCRTQHSVDAPYCRRANWWKHPERTSHAYREVPSYQSPKYPTRFFLSRILFRKKAKTTEKKFQHYLSKWKEETGGDSSLTNITSNMNYLRIISIGKDAIPLILQQLQQEPAPWFVALRAISEDDSVGQDSPGDFRKKAAAWIKWGKKHEHIR